MTVNAHNRVVRIAIGPQGLGRQLVAHHPGKIERVVVRSAHGVPHVLDALEHPGSAWIEVLGAVPDTEVTVAYYVED